MLPFPPCPALGPAPQFPLLTHSTTLFDHFVEFAAFVNAAAENQAVYKQFSGEKVAKFNAPVFLANKEKIGYALALPCPLTYSNICHHFLGGRRAWRPAGASIPPPGLVPSPFGQGRAGSGSSFSFGLR